MKVIIDIPDGCYNEICNGIFPIQDAYRIVAWIKDGEQLLPKGHWIEDEFGMKCSCCRKYTHLDKFERPMKLLHCSMCGAKMEKSEEKDV